MISSLLADLSWLGYLVDCGTSLWRLAVAEDILFKPVPMFVGVGLETDWHAIIFGGGMDLPPGQMALQ